MQSIEIINIDNIDILETANSRFIFKKLDKISATYLDSKNLKKLTKYPNIYLEISMTDLCLTQHLAGNLHLTMLCCFEAP